MKRAADFRRARSAGRSAQGKFLRVTVAIAPDGGLRFGVVTSRRTGPAVERSRARRLIREFLRKWRHGVFEGKLVIVSAKAGAGKANLEELEREWLILAGRLSILRVSK